MNLIIIGLFVKNSHLLLMKKLHIALCTLCPQKYYHFLKSPITQSNFYEIQKERIAWKSV